MQYINTTQTPQERKLKYQMVLLYGCDVHTARRLRDFSKSMFLIKLAEKCKYGRGDKLKSLLDKNEKTNNKIQ